MENNNNIVPETEEISSRQRGPKGHGDNPNPSKIKIYSEPATIFLAPTDLKAQAVLTNEHVDFKISVSTQANNHSIGAAHRTACENRMALILARTLSKAGVEPKPITVLYPRKHEVDLWSKRLKIMSKSGKDKNKTEGEDVFVDFQGYRPEKHGTDWARDREIFDTDLKRSDYFVMTDVLYYFSPGELCELFQEHPSIANQGVTVLACQRDLPSEPNSVHLDLYNWPATEKVKIPYTIAVKETVTRTDAEGNVLYNKLSKKQLEANRKAEEDNKRPPHVAQPATYTSKVYKTEHVVIPATSGGTYVEAYGIVDFQGVMDFRASMKPGDSFYCHVVKSDTYYKYPLYVVETKGARYQVTSHGEGGAGYHSVLRIHIRKLGEEEQGESCLSHTRRRAFVEGGVIPSMGNFAIKMAIKCNAESATALASLQARLWDSLPTRIGTQFRDLQPLYDWMSAVKGTANMAIRATQSEPWQLPPNLRGGSVAAANGVVSDRVVETTGLPRCIGDAWARITAKQTNKDLIVELVGLLVAILKGAWERIKDLGRWCYAHLLRGEIKPLDFCSAFAQAGSVAMKLVGLKYLRKNMAQFLAKASHLWFLKNYIQKETLSSVVSVVGLAIYCFGVALAEEAVKRYTPLWFSLLFGMVESLLRMFVEYSEGRVDVFSYLRISGLTLISIVFHVLLRLTPFPIAVIIHTLVDFIAHSMYPDFWNNVLAEIRSEEERELMEDTREMVPITKPQLDLESPVYAIIDDERVPVSLAWISDHIEEPRRQIVLDTPSAREMVQPSSGAADAFKMIIERMEKEVNEPDEGAWELHTTAAIDSFFRRIVGMKGKVVIFDYDELEQYVLLRPWNKRRKAEYFDMILKLREGSPDPHKQKIFVKIDEILKDKRVSDDPVCKSRPIFPITAEGVDMMRLTIPFKEFFSGTHYFVNRKSDDEGTTGWEYHGPERPDDLFVVSITYCAEPRQDTLSEVISSFEGNLGFHVILHGDDSVIRLNTSTFGVSIACDLAFADLTEGLDAQKSIHRVFEHVSDVLEEAERLCKQNFGSLTGELKLLIKGYTGPQLYYEKTRPHTNTGEAATTVKHFVVQVIAYLVIAAMMFSYQGLRRPLEDYEKVHRRIFRSLGLVPEFEIHHKTGIFHKMQGVTFLSGTIVESPFSTVPLVWVPNKYLKAYTIFPNVEKIYGHQRLDFNLHMHVMVLLTDREMEISPIGRAIASWFNRALKGWAAKQNLSGRQLSMLQNKALAKYEQFLESHDRWASEIWHNKKSYQPYVVDDDVYFESIAHYIEREEQPVVTAHDLQVLCEMIAELETLPAKLDDNHALYRLRFG